VADGRFPLAFRSVSVEFGHQFQEALRERLLEEIVVRGPQFGRYVPLTGATDGGTDILARSREQHDISLRTIR
jgi:hypothetical protein